MKLYLVLSRDPYHPTGAFTVVEAIYTTKEGANRWRYQQAHPWDYEVQQRVITPRWHRTYPYCTIP